jgi:hypothetical protein
MPFYAMLTLWAYSSAKVENGMISDEKGEVTGR